MRAKSCFKVVGSTASGFRCRYESETTDRGVLLELVTRCDIAHGVTHHVARLQVELLWAQVKI